MNLDWFPGQRVVCVKEPDFEYNGAEMIEHPRAVRVGEIYVVVEAWASPGQVPNSVTIIYDEGVWLRLEGVQTSTTRRHWFDSRLFRPVEPEAMKTLRGLLTPGPGVRAKEDA